MLAQLLERLKVDDRDADHYELVCNKKVLPPSMNVGTIRNCIWRSGADIQLLYRKKAATPAAPAAPA